MVETAKAARHSDPKLTLRVYSHVNLGELYAAVSAMPEPKTCTPAQVANSMSLKTSLDRGKTGVIGAHSGMYGMAGNKGAEKEKPP